MFNLFNISTMKAKKVTVLSTQCIAFDNHQAHVQGAGVSGTLQFATAAECPAVGDEISISAEPKGKAKK